MPTEKRVRVTVTPSPKIASGPGTQQVGKTGNGGGRGEEMRRRH